MQLLQQYQRLWFVCLMIFFIGGSSMVMAAVQWQSAQHTQTRMTPAKPCHAQKINPAPLMVSHDDMSHSAPCHNDDVAVQHGQHGQHCKTCNSLSHCQMVNFALDTWLPNLSFLPYFARSTYKNTAYHARHLVGYGHTILRPPKT